MGLSYIDTDLSYTHIPVFLSVLAFLSCVCVCSCVRVRARVCGVVFFFGRVCFYVQMEYAMFFVFELVKIIERLKHVL